jgi:hypothetical protein
MMLASIHQPPQYVCGGRVTPSIPSQGTNRSNATVLGQECPSFTLQLRRRNVNFQTTPAPQGGLMGDLSERRVARRFAMSLPLRVLPREARTSELRTQTRDVSYQGLYFLAQAPFDVGSEIEFVITLPHQVAQTGDVDIRCRGQIVRVEPVSNGQMGVAAKIERYEFLPATASAA